MIAVPRPACRRDRYRGKAITQTLLQLARYRENGTATAATTTASVQRHRHRENDTATAAIAEPLVIKRGCCDNLCGNYVVIVFAKVSLGFLVVIRVVVCCCFNLLKCSDGRVNLFRPCRSLCRHCCRYTLFVEDLNLMLDSGEKKYL